MSENEFTIIIQGPLNQISLDNIERYKKFGDVIVSCWAGEMEPANVDAMIIKSPKPKGQFANPQNIFMQSTTVLAGLAAARTPYFIKVRSDEKYTNLEPIMFKVMTSPEKYICNNVWFKKINREWLHPSDHLFAGDVYKFINTFDDVMSICRRIGPVNNVLSCLQYGFNTNFWPYLSVESVIFLSFLKTIYRNALESVIADCYYNNRLRNLMEEHCDFVPIESLGEYVWSFVNLQGKREYLSSSDILYSWDSPSIKSFEEI